MAANQEAIHCEGLTKRFGKVRALDGLSLSVEKGTVFGFLGPNGAGKTTTLRLLAGLTHPSAGRVWVAGNEVTTNSLRLQSSIGYLPETPAFYGWMTGREFLLFTADLYGLDRGISKKRTGELLGQVNLEEAAGRRVKTYSKGMQQRLGLAQALMNKPDVLLLDEPAAALDPIGRRDTLEMIERLKGETTVFISTHILADVERICNRIGIINRGKLIATGTIDELRGQRSQSLFEIETAEETALAVSRLKPIPWIRSCQVRDGNGRQTLQVNVSDLEVAKKELPGVLVNGGLTLLRYELVSASLEDIFVDLVKSEEKST